MRFNLLTRRTALAAALVSVLAFGTAPTLGDAAAAELSDQNKRQFLADTEENRFAFLGSDVPEVVLTSSNVCSLDGGTGCEYLAAVSDAMPAAVSAARSQGQGKDLDEMIETFDLPADIKALIRDAVAEDMQGVGRGPNQVTVSIGDEFDFVALLHMLDSAIESAKANIP